MPAEPLRVQARVPMCTVQRGLPEIERPPEPAPLRKPAFKTEESSEVEYGIRTLSELQIRRVPGRWRPKRDRERLVVASLTLPLLAVRPAFLPVSVARASRRNGLVV